MPTLIMPLLADVADQNAATVADGVPIAVMGMLIVMCALILITTFIASLPKLLTLVAHVWPEAEEPHASQSHPESFVPDDESVLAAIGFVLHQERHSRQAGATADKA